ncbi:MAG: hypothetical protein KDC07_03645 [Chitinophagaceae bacterium]|nr:hypothetical protein [Chitinophagaceae bacterium]MCB9045367.1 hypothetical protein [Chitinophagales bacterium]
MKQTTRELLVTTKVAESWQQNFDGNVDGLMLLVSKVDNQQHVENVTELLNVYRNQVEDLSTPQAHKKQESSWRPFEFTVFRN